MSLTLLLIFVYIDWHVKYGGAFACVAHDKIAFNCTRHGVYEYTGLPLRTVTNDSKKYQVCALCDVSVSVDKAIE